MCKRETQTSGVRERAQIRRVNSLKGAPARRGSPPLRMGSLGHHERRVGKSWRLGQKSSLSLSLPARSDLLKIYPRARNHLSIDGLERVLNFERLRFRRGCWFSTVLAFDLLPLDAISCPPPLPAMEEIRQGRIFLRLFLCFSFELPRTEFISPVLSSFQFSFVERIDLKGFFFFFRRIFIKLFRKSEGERWRGIFGY